MFVDRQSIFRYLWSLILTSLSHEILGFQAANIGKIRKTQTFFPKKVTFSGKKRVSGHRFQDYSWAISFVSGGDDGAHRSAGSSASA